VHEQDVGQVRDHAIGAGPPLSQLGGEHVHDRAELAGSRGGGAGYVQQRRQQRQHGMGPVVLEGELTVDQVHGGAAAAQVHDSVHAPRVLGQQFPAGPRAAVAGACDRGGGAARQHQNVSADELHRRVARRAQPAAPLGDDEEGAVIDAVAGQSPAAACPKLHRHHPGNPVGGQDLAECIHVLKGTGRCWVSGVAARR
jgi:hypothetical protein